MTSTPSRMPVVFATQGFPLLLDSRKWADALGGWGRALPRPKAILVISAHWVTQGVVIGSTASPVPLYYDYSGFPRRFYQLEWPAPPAIEVAKRVRELVGPAGQAPDRGLDHGAFVPLMLMFPQHDVPVVQISQPSLDPGELIELGRKLAPLRDEGVLIFATGSLTHVGYGAGEEAPPMAAFADFDAWTAREIREGNLAALSNYEREAPGVDTVLPTREHFTPLFVALGAAGDLESAEFPTAGFWYGNSMRSVELR